MVPKRLRSASHPATQPGTVIVCTLIGSSLVMFWAFRYSMVSAFGVQPLEFRPYNFPVFAS